MIETTELEILGSSAAMCAGFVDTFNELRKNKKNKWIPNPMTDLPLYRDLYDMGVKALNKADWSESTIYKKDFLQSLLDYYEQNVESS